MFKAFSEKLNSEGGWPACSDRDGGDAIILKYVATGAGFWMLLQAFVHTKSDRNCCLIDCKVGIDVRLSVFGKWQKEGAFRRRSFKQDTHPLRIYFERLHISYELYNLHRLESITQGFSNAFRLVLSLLIMHIFSQTYISLRLLFLLLDTLPVFCKSKVTNPSGMDVWDAGWRQCWVQMWISRHQIEYILTSPG